jgi:hypothetical protein
MSHKYQDLVVWQKAKTLATDVYRTTEVFVDKFTEVRRLLNGLINSLGRS